MPKIWKDDDLKRFHEIFDQEDLSWVRLENAPCFPTRSSSYY